MAEQSRIIYDDEQVTFDVKRKKDIGPFQAIGRLDGMNDIFKRLRKVSKAAYDLFDDLKDTRDYKTNLCYLSTSGMTSSKRKMRTSRIKELRDAGLILKAKTVNKLEPIKKGSYLLNPFLLKCTYDPEGAEAMWVFLGGTNGKCV